MVSVIVEKLNKSINKDSPKKKKKSQKENNKYIVVLQVTIVN
jgi:hypothetical protein